MFIPVSESSSPRFVFPRLSDFVRAPEKEAYIERRLVEMAEAGVLWWTGVCRFGAEGRNAASRVVLGETLNEHGRLNKRPVHPTLRDYQVTLDAIPGEGAIWAKTDPVFAGWTRRGVGLGFHDIPVMNLDNRVYPGGPDAETVTVSLADGVRFLGQAGLHCNGDSPRQVGRPGCHVTRFSERKPDLWDAWMMEQGSAIGPTTPAERDKQAVSDDAAAQARLHSRERPSKAKGGKSRARAR